MKYPIVVSMNKRLSVGREDFFRHIGELDLPGQTLEMNVTSSGKSGLNWLLDADGVFYELSLIEKMPPNLLQRIGLRRAREKFRIIPGRKITVQELTERISGLEDPFEEAANVNDLKTLLDSLPRDHRLTPKDMSRYLGE